MLAMCKQFALPVDVRALGQLSLPKRPNQAKDRSDFYDGAGKCIAQSDSVVLNFGAFAGQSLAFMASSDSGPRLFAMDRRFRHP